MTQAKHEKGVDFPGFSSISYRPVGFGVKAKLSTGVRNYGDVL